MKDTSKEILAAAIGIAAGSALGVLLANIQLHRGEHRAQDSSCASRKREKLLFVKGKMEMHRERLEKHLSRINAKIEALGGSGISGTVIKEHTLLKPDPALI
jgi:hypothetical protein